MHSLSTAVVFPWEFTFTAFLKENWLEKGLLSFRLQPRRENLGWQDMMCTLISNHTATDQVLASVFILSLDKEDELYILTKYEASSLDRWYNT